MNNPNPFVPQGSLLEQQSKRRSRMKLGVFCVLTVGVAGLMAMLIQGCKRDQSETADNGTPPADTNNFAADTNNSPMVDTNPPVPPVVTNPPVVAPTPPPAPETAATTEYVVIKGDSFARIAKKFGVSMKAVEDANPGIAPTRLKVGEKISIPASSGGGAAAAETSNSTSTSGADTGEEVYKVKSGDTLTKIARHFSTTVKAIESENNLSTTKIKVGQKLKIPASATTVAPASAPEPASVTPPATTAAPSGQ